MSSPADHKPPKKAPKTPSVPIPSASVLVISPTNQILLLSRVRTSSAFPSAHVFPGGAVSPEHDGELPHADHPSRHLDGPQYRMAAIRETFEESGILLARSHSTGNLVTGINDQEREQGRKAVHNGTIKFEDLLTQWNCYADTQNLIKFTRWITPPTVPKRFTTIMYLYLIGLDAVSATKSIEGAPPSSGVSEENNEIIIPNPTSDGGIEHTSARFLPPNKWIDLARQNRIILYPPQFFLTYILSSYLSPTVTSPTSPIPSTARLQQERDRLLEFLAQPGRYEDGPGPSFGDAIISPVVLGKGEYGEKKQDGVGGVDKGTAVLALDRPGPEVESDEKMRGHRGLWEWVVTARFRREGPRDVEVRRRGDVLGRGEAGGKL